MPVTTKKSRALLLDEQKNETDIKSFLNIFIKFGCELIRDNYLSILLISMI